MHGVAAASIFHLTRDGLFLTAAMPAAAVHTADRYSLFMGELWNFSEVPPWLPQYWSLGYEVWYYVFFASVFYLRGMQRLVVSALIFALLGHKLWLLLPVWMSGVLLYKMEHRRKPSVELAWVGWLTTLVSLALFKHFCLDD